MGFGAMLIIAAAGSNRSFNWWSRDARTKKRSELSEQRLVAEGGQHVERLVGAAYTLVPGPWAQGAVQQCALNTVVAAPRKRQ